MAKAEKRQEELMPRISAHSLRHTGCTRMAEMGLDMKCVQYVMGHPPCGTSKMQGIFEVRACALYVWIQICLLVRKRPAVNLIHPCMA